MIYTDGITTIAHRREGTYPGRKVHPHHIVGYTYRADVYCRVHAVQEAARNLGVERPDHYADIPEDWRELAELAGIDDHDDEYSYDSDDFPKIVLACQLDGDERCARCGHPLV